MKKTITCVVVAVAAVLLLLSPVNGLAGTWLASNYGCGGGGCDLDSTDEAISGRASVAVCGLWGLAGPWASVGCGIGWVA